MPDPTTWPDFQNEMPYEEDVDQAAEAGALMRLVDNTERIDELLAEWNEQWDQGEGGGEGGSDSGGAASGCGCMAGSSPAGLGVLALLGLWGFARRRRAQV